MTVKGTKNDHVNEAVIVTISVSQNLTPSQNLVYLESKKQICFGPSFMMSRGVKQLPSTVTSQKHHTDTLTHTLRGSRKGGETDTGQKG